MPHPAGVGGRSVTGQFSAQGGSEGGKAPSGRAHLLIPCWLSPESELRDPTCLALLQRRGSQCIWDLVHSGAAPAPHGLFVQCARPHSRKLTVGTKQRAAFASGVLQPWPSALWPSPPSSRLSPKPSWGTSGNSHPPGQTYQRGDTWLQNGGGRKLRLGTSTCPIHSLVAKY